MKTELQQIREALGLAYGRAEVLDENYMDEYSKALEALTTIERGYLMIKPCPFCGGEADFSPARAKIECQGDWCNAVMCGVQGDEELIKAWNTRTRPAAPAVDLEGIISEMQLRFFGHKEIARRVVVALAEEGHLAQGWMPIESAPKDGTQTLPQPPKEEDE